MCEVEKDWAIQHTKSGFPSTLYKLAMAGGLFITSRKLEMSEFLVTNFLIHPLFAAMLFGMSGIGSVLGLRWVLVM